MYEIFIKKKDKIRKVRTRILPFRPAHNFEPEVENFLLYQRKSLIARVQGVSLLITETITHIKDNRRVIA